MVPDPMKLKSNFILGISVILLLEVAIFVSSKIRPNLSQNAWAQINKSNAETPLDDKKLWSIEREALKNRDYVLALRAAKRSLYLREQKLGSDNPDIANYLFSVFDILEKQGNWSEATKYIKRQLDINLKTHGENHQKTATSLYSLASNQVARGLYDDAIENQKRSIAILENLGDVSGAQLSKTWLKRWENGRVSASTNKSEKLVSEGNKIAGINALEEAITIRKNTPDAKQEDIAFQLAKLAELQIETNQVQEAVGSLTEAIKIYESQFGINNYRTERVFKRRSDLLRSKGRLTEISADLERVLPIFRSVYGENDFRTQSVLSDLSQISSQENIRKNDWSGVTDLRILQEKSLELEQAYISAKNKEHFDHSLSLAQTYLTVQTQIEKISRFSNKRDAFLRIAESYLALSQLPEAENYYKKALSKYDETLGPADFDTLEVFKNLVLVLKRQKKIQKLEELYSSRLTTLEKSLVITDFRIASLRRDYSKIHEELTGKPLDVEEILKLEIAQSEKVNGPDSIETARKLVKYANYLHTEHGEKVINNIQIPSRSYDVEPLLLRALEIHKKDFGENHKETKLVKGMLRDLYFIGDNYRLRPPAAMKAMSKYLASKDNNTPRKALSFAKMILESDLLVMDSQNAYIAEDYERVGDQWLELKNYERAIQSYQAALEIFETHYDNRHFTFFTEVFRLNRKLFSIFDIVENKNFKVAFKHLKSMSELSEHYIHSRLLYENSLEHTLRLKKEKDNFVETHYKTASFSINYKSSLINEKNSEIEVDNLIFRNIQLATQSKASDALSQLSARKSATTDELGRLIRHREELIEEWSDGNALNERQATIYQTLSEINKTIESEHPEYFNLSSPKPLNLSYVQNLITENEAIVQFLTGSSGTVVTVLTKAKVDWTLVDVDASELETAVRVLRASLENPQQAFPRGQAHGIYKELMSSVEYLVSDKDHLFLVPSGALGSIPLGVLVVDAPEGDDSSPEALRATKWWGTEQALTTLPSISSLKALRLLAKDGRGTEPFAGFGNPVLTGPDGTDRSVQYASRGAGAYFRGKYADVEAVRSLSPLPKTETELLSLASAMRTAPEQSLWLGDRATETNLKSANLSEKRVLAFATHGLMSGEMSGLAEPALVLTPPDNATDQDDGLLTASEAALLDLNADWVILSACNTAAADEPGADGLSGLARSFFYAGARSMLVSHWPVRDDAAARLTTAAISMQDDNPDLGRAEALRRSMLVLMNDTSDPTLAHPSAWAPFVIVGEGGSETATNNRSFDPVAFKTTEIKAPKANSGAVLWGLIGGMALLLIAGIAALTRRRRTSPSNV